MDGAARLEGIGELAEAVARLFAGQQANAAPVAVCGDGPGEAARGETWGEVDFHLVEGAVLDKELTAEHTRGGFLGQAQAADEGVIGSGGEDDK